MLGANEGSVKGGFVFSLKEFLFYLWRLGTLYRIANITQPQSRNINLIHELCAVDVSSVGVLEKTIYMQTRCPLKLREVWTL